MTEDQKSKLRELAMKEVPNGEIAKQIGVPVSMVYAYRSKQGLTRAAVRRMLGRQPAAAVDDVVDSCFRRRIDCLRKLSVSRLAEWLENYRFDSSQVCELCPKHESKPDCDGDDGYCRAALVRYLEEVGEL